MNYLKTINISIIFIIITSMISVAAAAESIPKLNVGHEDIDISFIKPYESEYEFFLIGKDDNLIPGGRWTDKVDLFEKEQQKYLTRKVVRFSNQGVEDLKRVTIGQAKTLAPTSNHQVSGENLDVMTFFHFAGQKISAALINSASFDIKQLDVTLDQSPFDLSFWAILASSLPFEVGYQAALPVYKPGSDKVGWENFKVSGKETIKIDSENYATFRVETSPSNWKFWLRKERPYIVKIEHPYGETTAVSFLTKDKSGSD
jgi:hypothetical protein